MQTNVIRKGGCLRIWMHLVIFAVKPGWAEHFGLYFFED
jgi:hypothetical protein